MLTLTGGGARSGIVRRRDAIGEVDAGDCAFSKASMRAFGFEGSLPGPDYSCIEANSHVVPPVRPGLRRVGNSITIQGSVVPGLVAHRDQGSRGSICHFNGGHRALTSSYLRICPAVEYHK